MRSIFRHLVVSLLTFEAKILLARHKPTIIAVTGSVGKTSMKDAIYAVLRNHTSARKSENRRIGESGVHDDIGRGNQPRRLDRQ